MGEVHRIFMRRWSFVARWLACGALALGCGARTSLEIVGGTASAPPPLRQRSNRLSVGEYHVCAIRSGGQVYCWGANSYGQVGSGNRAQEVRRPERVGHVDDAIAVAAGGEHTCVLHADGGVSCWGSVGGGRIGDGRDLSGENAYESSLATRVPDLSDVVELEAGWLHTCALRSDGTVLCWGKNPEGALGDGSFERRSRPTAVAGLEPVAHLSAGNVQTCTVSARGDGICWGSNFAPSSLPSLAGRRFRIEWPSSVERLCCAYAHICAQDARGSLSCAGSGYLGDGAIHVGDGPTIVDIDDVVAFDCGGSKTCAIRRGGSVHCWGGDGSSSQGPLGRSTPALVPGITDAVAISVGGGAANENVICVERANGDLACWGRNSEGELGDGTTSYRSQPVRVQGLPDP